MTSETRSSPAFIRRILGGTDSQSRRRRTHLGALVTALMLPVLIAVMGCIELPAPVGDPEKSRIDPGMSGVWIEDGESMLIFEPYDKRTWLVRSIDLIDNEKYYDALEESEESEPEIVEIPGNEGTSDQDLEEIVVDDDSVDLSQLDRLRAGALEIEGVSLFKAWRTRMSESTFITFEPRGMISEETGMDPGSGWVVAKREFIDEDHLSLQFISSELEGIEEGMTRTQLERIVRRNLDNPDLFLDDMPWILERIPVEDYAVLADMLREAGVDPDYD